MNDQLKISVQFSDIKLWFTVVRTNHRNKIIAIDQKDQAILGMQVIKHDQSRSLHDLGDWVRTDETYMDKYPIYVKVSREHKDFVSVTPFRVSQKSITEVTRYRDFWRVFAKALVRKAMSIFVYNMTGRFYQILNYFKRGEEA